MGKGEFRFRPYPCNKALRDSLLAGVSDSRLQPRIPTLLVVPSALVLFWTRAGPSQRLGDAGAYLFLDGVSLRVRRPAGRQRVQMLVA